MKFPLHVVFVFFLAIGMPPLEYLNFLNSRRATPL